MQLTEQVKEELEYLFVMNSLINNSRYIIEIEKLECTRYHDLTIWNNDDGYDKIVAKIHVWIGGNRFIFKPFSRDVLLRLEKMGFVCWTDINTKEKLFKIVKNTLML